MPNHLAGEQSPYLLQHAHNPVDWYPWGPEALEKARDLDRPIFLSVGYATCHWCHVMAHESFEDQEVADLLNAHYVAIKVDREERPDLDAIYMAVCQALTNRGGWPLSVFLTPGQQPFLAGTYFPKHRRMGHPGFVEILREVARRWQSPERERMARAAQDITQAIRPQAPEPGQLGDDVLIQAHHQFTQAFDPRWGGFGGAPKFPTPHNLLFLLRHKLRAQKPGALTMVEKTLLAMRDGGIFDQVGFGFHRYSVDEKWLVPHFEKMLYDQAQIAYACLEAFQLGGRPRLAQAAREVFAYVRRELTHPDGGFFSAEDADSEGVEGRYYVWTPAELTRVLGADDAAFYARVMDITEAGNFEDGHSIPHPVQPAATDQGIPPAQAEARLEGCRQRLLAARGRRVRPLLDDKVLTAWNGLMIAALAKGAQVLEAPDLAAEAARAADFVLERLGDGRGGLDRRWRRGAVSGPGFLEDHAFFVWGLIELYQATFDARRLAQALALQEVMDRRFWDAEHGGYFFTPSGHEELIFRDKEVHDGAVPSGNSVAAWNLFRLAGLTGRLELADRGHEVLRAFAGQVRRHPMAYTMLLCALDHALGPEQQIVIAGPADHPQTRELVRVARRRYLPRATVLLKDPGQADALGRLAPFTRLLEGRGDGPLAYVCAGHACQTPVAEPEALEDLLP